MATKWMLLIGDHEGPLMDDVDSDYMKIREIGLNFDQSPSIAVVYEVYSELAKEMAEELRGNNVKVGVYGTREKAMGFMDKCLNMAKLGDEATSDTI